MIDCGFRLSANNFLFVADTDTCKITLYRLLPIIQPSIGATLIIIIVIIGPTNNLVNNLVKNKFHLLDNAMAHEKMVIVGFIVFSLIGH